MLYQKIMVSTWLIWHLLLFFSLKWPDMGLKWTFICSKFSLYPSNFYQFWRGKLRFFYFWKFWKELPENHQNGQFLQKNIFTFGTAKTKCQQRARVFQLILINWNPIKMIKKVWFEKARELTLQSHLKSVSLVKKSIKSWFLKFF